MDNNMVKKVLTFKSGKFVFGRKFDRDKLLKPIIEAQILYKTVSYLPILPNLAEKLEEEIIRRSIFGTAAIEGNPLNEEEVNRILSRPESTEKLEQAKQEIRNLKTAYDFVASLQPSGSPLELTEDIVKKVHHIITKDIEYPYNRPGHYRDHIVKVGNEEHGGIYTPPKILADIETLMKEFISWINSKEITEGEPAIRAGLAHYHLALIHPFGDGNGRTARLIEALLLRTAGIKYVPIMLSNFYYRNMDEYFWTFSNSINNKEKDITPFMEFFFRGVIDSLEDIRERITSLIRTLALRDYYSFLKGEKAITQRQHDLLTILLEQLQPLRLVDLLHKPPFTMLYGKVSERTARRDLKQLLDNNLLNLEGNSYTLNLRVLG